ncbi:50S ribosomal protein L20 [Candidatus Parcubacteria bacterium]|mgnify:CR=1 FL=1|nr:50S ribosomal protein L20 [Candidatus Parcubacteria bacterium]HPM08793.1 50S ribosomal protein L20 [Candidatus Pacearchaeota archaeon]
MPRVKRGTIANKRRKNILKDAKGYRHGRKSKVKFAKEAIAHAGVYAYRDRKNKKRVFRKLWQTKINAAVRMQGITYSKFIAGLKKNKIELDRKVLSEMAVKYPEVLKSVIAMAKN